MLALNVIDSIFVLKVTVNFDLNISRGSVLVMRYVGRSKGSPVIHET